MGASSLNLAAEANHTTHSKRRKELDRLFVKLQMFLDIYADQSESATRWGERNGNWWSKNLFKLYRTPELGKGEENQPCPLKSFSVRLTVKVGRAA